MFVKAEMLRAASLSRNPSMSSVQTQHTEQGPCHLQHHSHQSKHSEEKVFDAKGLTSEYKINKSITKNFANRVEGKLLY